MSHFMLNAQAAPITDIHCKVCEGSFFVFNSDFADVQVCPFCGPTQIEVQVKEKRKRVHRPHKLDELKEKIRSMIFEDGMKHAVIAKKLDIAPKDLKAYIRNNRDLIQFPRGSNETDQQTQAE